MGVWKLILQSECTTSGKKDDGNAFGRLMGEKRTRCW